MKNITLKLFIVVLLVFLSSCTHDYIEYPTVKGRELMLSKDNVIVAKNSEAIVEIVSGVGSYTVTPKDNTKVKVKLIGKKIYIEALKKGETDIIVLDNQTNIEKKLNVTIDEIDFEEMVLVLVEKTPYKFGPIKIDFKKDFKIGKYEVTVHQFCAFISETDKYCLRKSWSGKLTAYKFLNIKSEIINDKIIYTPNPGKGDLPVVGVYWDMAKEYCESKGGRLPSETEWEYAAQGGKDGPRHGNVVLTYNDIKDYVWWPGNTAYGDLYAVQTKKSNMLGIHNMIGNAAEWCQDNVISYYNQVPLDGIAFEDGKAYHIIRGGSTGSNYRVKSTIHNTRGNSTYQIKKSNSIGFRIAYTIE